MFTFYEWVNPFLGEGRETSLYTPLAFSVVLERLYCQVKYVKQKSKINLLYHTMSKF